LGEQTRGSVGEGYGREWEKIYEFSFEMVHFAANVTNAVHRRLLSEGYGEKTD